MNDLVWYPNESLPFQSLPFQPATILKLMNPGAIIDEKMLLYIEDRKLAFLTSFALRRWLHLYLIFDDKEISHFKRQKYAPIMGLFYWFNTRVRRRDDRVKGHQ